MKAVSDALNTMLLEYIHGIRKTFYIAELYMFQLNSGQLLLYTGHDTNLSIGGNVYERWPIEHGDITETRGTEVSDTDVNIFFNPTDTITGLGTTWFKALQSGAFDNATVSIDRLYSPIPWQYIMPNISSDYVLKGRFVGRVDVDDLKLTSTKLKVKSILELLNDSNTKIPKNLLMPSCINIFGDTMCGVNKELYATTFTCQNGSTKSSLVTGLNYADNYFFPGSVLCLTGNNAGAARPISSYASGIIKNISFSLPVAVGDTFKAYRLCANTIAACEAYGNLAKYRGYPFIPCQETLM